MKLSLPVYRLKRNARLLAREFDIPLHQALDRVARQEGFASWSLLAAQLSAVPVAARLLAGFEPGNLVLLAARPGHGKTRLGLEIATEALSLGRHALFFTLEYNAQDVHGLLADMDRNPVGCGDRFVIDTSDAICAEHVIARLAGKPAGSVAVIDYLQLLDQDRNKPDLETQLGALESFARTSGVILLFLSQVDRGFELSQSRVPGLDDVRLPNPADLGRFSRTCFLNDGEMRLT